MSIQGGAVSGRLMPASRTVAKNATALVVLAGIWLALDTGYLTPDRPTRSQWEVLEKSKQAKAGALVYQSDFSRESPGGAVRSGETHWGYYNGATISTVQYEPASVTIRYNGVSWIGAALHFTPYEPQRIYRITIDRTVEGEPGAIIVRNRQMDLTREQIPVGTGTFATEFLAPKGSRDKVVIAFIPDGRDKPQGTMRIRSVRIEKMGE